MFLSCSYYSIKFSIKVKATNFAYADKKKKQNKTKKRFHLAQFPNDLSSFLIFGNYILSYIRLTCFYFNGFTFI